ncbi:MAG TPA: hypothetical protein VF549_19585 [Solirubrobacteraceae bacterium]|jgi:hypothetical protein
MDRIERIGPRSPRWLQPAIDPDREDVAKRRREEERRRRERRQEQQQDREPSPDDEPPHQIDVRA